MLGTNLTLYLDKKETKTKERTVWYFSAITVFLTVYIEIEILKKEV